jgi:hypothetical protein
VLCWANQGWSLGGIDISIIGNTEHNTAFFDNVSMNFQRLVCQSGSLPQMDFSRVTIFLAIVDRIEEKLAGF